MSGYRPTRASRLGAHVTGAPAYILASLLQRAKAESQLVGLTPEDRAATLATMDDIRSAARIWDMERRGGEASTLQEARASRATSGAVASLLTTSQAAEALGVSTRRVRQLADAGVLEGVKVGRQWQLDPGSVQARQLADELI